MVECNFIRYKVEWKKVQIGPDGPPLSLHLFVKNVKGDDVISDINDGKIYCGITANHDECDGEDCVLQQRIKLLKEIKENQVELANGIAGKKFTIYGVKEK
jgi:hypothetical protein